MIDDRQAHTHPVGSAFSREPSLIKMPLVIPPKYEMIMYESSRNTYRVCMQKSYKKLMKETEED